MDQALEKFNRKIMDLNMKVLIVDDFATMRRILRNILKQIGFTNITEADDGSTALKELKKEKYDLRGLVPWWLNYYNFFLKELFGSAEKIY